MPPPRSWSSTGLLDSAVDGNIIGGLLLGTGMALSSSCPGMVFPQLALGIPAAPTILAGGCTGGIVWSALLRPWLARRRQTSRAERPPLTSLSQALGLGHTTTFLLYETVIALAVTVVVAKTSTAWSPTNPVVGGLLIGGAQLVSLLLRKTALGASTCYEQLGDWIVYLVKGGRGDAQPGTSAMLFTAAMAGGAWALAALRPDLAPSIAYGDSTPTTSTGMALAGGFLMAVGSRLAGGCASGHGISGLALMSMSSLVTMVATFAAAIGTLKYMA